MTVRAAEFHFLEESSDGESPDDNRIFRPTID